MQYKNTAQNSHVPPIEVAVKNSSPLLTRKPSNKAVNLEVDDVEASETPEDVLLGAVSGDQSKDRTDHALVTPWLKFCRESHRTALDTLKNNARLEVICQVCAAS
jgi:translation initiation factor 3 subunit A